MSIAGEEKNLEIYKPENDEICPCPGLSEGRLCSVGVAAESFSTQETISASPNGQVETSIASKTPRIDGAT